MIEKPLVKGITIDGPTSKDLDDAFWLSKTPDGWLLEISIADVASSIPPGSELDMKAKEMGCTRYFAEHNEPMFPRELSEDELSLWKGKLRNTLTVSIPISAKDLVIGEVVIQKTQLVSEAKLGYGYVDLVLNEKTETPLSGMLRDCNILAQALLEQRRNNGALAIYDLLTGYRTTEEGILVPITPDKRHQANIIIQEFMILTNRLVAKYFAERDMSVLYRNHSAKAIGTDRASLLSDLVNTSAHPDRFSAETLRQRVTLVMGRATYGVHVGGHYALNLPAYLHLTSPIRRYADLVNHRILHAMLDGNTSPYTQEELELLAQHLTGIDHEMKDRRMLSFRDLSQARTQRTIDNGTFRHLSSDDFHKVIKAACRSGQMTPGLEEEILKRLRSGYIIARDAYFILLEASQADEAWIRIKRELFIWLTQNLENSVTLFNLAIQEHKLSSMPHYSINSSGPGHALIFSGSGTLQIDGQTVTSEPCTAGSKKLAQQLIGISLIQKMMKVQSGIDIDWAPVFVKTADQSTSLCSDPSNVQNTKGALLEFCQRNKLQMPEFHSASQGSDHAPIFTVTASVAVSGNVITTEPCNGSTKKDAERAAAAKLMSLLAPHFSSEPSKDAGRASDPEMNAVSALQEFLAVRRKPLPTYTFQQTGPSHTPTITCTCTYDAPHEKKIVREAKGQNNKIAKQRAAKEVYDVLVRKSATTQ